MTKRPSEQQTFSWVIFRVKNTLAHFVGTVEASDEAAAIAKAVAEFNVPADERGQLLAQRRP